MKRHLPLLVVVLALAYLGSTLRESAPQKPFDLAAFGRVPVLVNGRIKPLDTVARTSILTMQGRQTVKTPDGQSLSPAAWLADVLFSPSVADHYRHFLIENRQVLDLLGLTPEQGDKGKRFSYSQIRAKAPELDRQARLAEAVEAPLRTAFQRQVTAVRSRVVLDPQLTATLQPPDSKDFYRELLDLEKKLPATVAAFRGEKAGQTHDVQLEGGPRRGRPLRLHESTGIPAHRAAGCQGCRPDPLVDHGRHVVRFAADRHIAPLGGRLCLDWRCLALARRRTVQRDHPAPAR